MKSSHFLAAAIALLTTGCVFDSSNSSGSDNQPAAAGRKLFVMGQLYSDAGGTGALDRVGSDSAVAVGIKTWPTSDVILGSDSTGLYVIERANSVVTRYDSGDLSRRGFQVNVGDGANPYAVAPLGGKVWVACYGSAFLKAIDPVAGRLVDSIDLSGYSDLADGQKIPFAVDVHAVGSKLAVTVGRLNGWNPGDSSLVVVVDPSSKQVEKRIALPWKNAYGVSWSGNQALVSCVGAWSDLDGGIVSVDLQAGTARKLVSEQDLGGDAVKAEFGPSGRFFVGVSDPAAYTVAVHVADLETGAKGAKISGSANVGGLAWDGSGLWLGDMSKTAPRVVRVDATGAVQWSHATTLPAGSLALVP